MGYIDNAKQWFKRKMKPTEAQFAQAFDWLRWKDESISMNDVTGLNAAITAKVDKAVFDAAIAGETRVLSTDDVFQIPAGYVLEKVLLIPEVDSLIKIGETEGGEEIAPIQEIKAEGKMVILEVFSLTLKDVYFSGIISDTTAVFFYRKVVEL